MTSREHEPCGEGIKTLQKSTWPPASLHERPHSLNATNLYRTILSGTLDTQDGLTANDRSYRAPFTPDRKIQAIMKILFLCTAHNSLSQRLCLELTALGHEISIEYALSGKVMLEAVELFDPNLIVCPFVSIVSLIGSVLLDRGFADLFSFSRSSRPRSRRRSTTTSARSSSIPASQAMPARVRSIGCSWETTARSRTRASY